MYNMKKQNFCRNIPLYLSFNAVPVLTIGPQRVINILFLLTISPWIVHWGYENKGNDHQLKKLLINKQILLVGTLGNNSMENMHADDEWKCLYSYFNLRCRIKASRVQDKTERRYG